MHIRKLRVERTEPIKVGSDSHGRKFLIKMVMDKGYSRVFSTKVVNAVFAIWIKALKNRETIELPYGTLKVVKTRKNSMNKVVPQRAQFGKPLKALKPHIINTRPFRFRYRVTEEEVKKFLETYSFPDDPKGPSVRRDRRIP